MRLADQVNLPQRARYYSAHLKRRNNDLARDVASLHRREVTGAARMFCKALQNSSILKGFRNIWQPEFRTDSGIRSSEALEIVKRTRAERSGRFFRIHAYKLTDGSSSGKLAPATMASTESRFRTSMASRSLRASRTEEPRATRISSSRWRTVSSSSTRRIFPAGVSLAPIVSADGAGEETTRSGSVMVKVAPRGGEFRT